MPKKQALVVAQNNSESSMKYRAEPAAISELSKKLQAEWAGVQTDNTIKCSESLKTNQSKPSASG